jgi:poly-gamma-glutamate synthesis protein (capsule biosynthesis protein)
LIQKQELACNGDCDAPASLGGLGDLCGENILMGTIVKLFLAGDVMLGRGIDQILPQACPPRLHERVGNSALDYVMLAERAHGPIPRPVDHAYVWGAALEILEAAKPDARIINLETAITTSEDALPKGINYRMHPGNVATISTAGIDCCVLANNHVLDWGEPGLLETLAVLATARIPVAGAGLVAADAYRPAVLNVDGKGRVLVFAYAATDSGVPRGWAADVRQPGVALLPDFSSRTVAGIARTVENVKRPGDVALCSIHWGNNWGYEIPSEHRQFAHALIDGALIDAVYGHSSHHAKAIELYRKHLILYGCGDFFDDYEGISGYEAFRGDLVLMYFPSFDVATGALVALDLIPLQIRNFRLKHCTTKDREWLRGTLDRECARFGHRIVLHADGLTLAFRMSDGKM